MENYFFTIFFFTILVARIFLYITYRFNYKLQAPKIGGFRMHHYMYGFILAPIGALLGNITLYAVGLGLFIDELGFVLIRGKSHEENYSKESLLLLVLFVFLVYFFREQVLFWR